MASNLPQALHSTINEAHLIYDTDSPIARGGSGDVFRAIWKSKTRGEVDIAAKKILLLDKSASDLLGNEISYLQKLDHPNIIKYHGHVITKRYVVIVTEYAHKGSLFKYLKDKKYLPKKLKLKWAIQGAKSIKYLRENRVLHRDIKSPNFLITADDNLKICDFGISKDLTSTKTTASEKGTVKWQAPESFTEYKLSPTADIFAFGIVLWELETCLEPYQGMPPMTVMYKVGNEGLRPEIPATCSPELRDLMQRCWDGDRAKRPDINEIIHQLQQCMDGDRTKRQHEVMGSDLPHDCLLAECKVELQILPFIEKSLAAANVASILVYAVKVDVSEIVRNEMSAKGKVLCCIAAPMTNACKNCKDLTMEITDISDKNRKRAMVIHKKKQEIRSEDLKRGWSNALCCFVLENIRPSNSIFGTLLVRQEGNESALSVIIDHTFAEEEPAPRQSVTEQVMLDAGGSTISDIEILDAGDAIRLPEMERICVYLQLSTVEIQDAKNSVQEGDILGRKTAMLHAWRRKLGDEATKQKLLEALLRSRNKEVYGKLKDKWEM